MTRSSFRIDSTDHVLSDHPSLQYPFSFFWHGLIVYLFYCPCLSSLVYFALQYLNSFEDWYPFRYSCPQSSQNGFRDSPHPNHLKISRKKKCIFVALGMDSIRKRLLLYGIRRLVEQHYNQSEQNIIGKDQSDWTIAEENYIKISLPKLPTSFDQKILSTSSTDQNQSHELVHHHQSTVEDIVM